MDVDGKADDEAEPSENGAKMPAKFLGTCCLLMVGLGLISPSLKTTPFLFVQNKDVKLSFSKSKGR